MNRKEEYDQLLLELKNTPPALENIVDHAKSRAKKSIYIRRFFAIPATCIAVFFIVFIGMVNCSITFTMACSKIPVLRELAAAVAFSPSLSAAVENEYVQPMGLEQNKKDITMRIEYVIVDQKQLNIFYTMASDRYTHLSTTPSILHTDGTSMDGYAISSDGYSEKNGALGQFIVEFTDKDMPGDLLLECDVYDYGNNTMTAPVATNTTESEMPKTPDTIATFSFALHFDPKYTHQGELITLNQWFDIDTQHLEITTIEIYPTHIRLNLADDKNNTAWLKSLNFYLENEKGKRFEVVNSGITATGAADSPMMSSYRLESTFFSRSKHFTLYITDAVWLDKSMERVKIDLANSQTDPLPQGVELEQVVRNGDNWDLTFSAIEKQKNSSYQLFGSEYYDASGKAYAINSWSTGSSSYFNEDTQQYIETPGRFNESFSLKNYPYDTVSLSPSFSRFVSLSKPVKINVR